MFCFPDFAEEAEEAKADGSGVNLTHQMYINKMKKLRFVVCVSLLFQGCM